MYSDVLDRYKVVNFTTETISMYFANQNCVFRGRRYWCYDPETVTFGSSVQHGNLMENHYAPEA